MLAQRIALLGALNSLSQITLKATMPGVPDFYQGTEFWDLSLVDPDNRRPVDFAERASVLASMERPDWQHLAQHWPDGHIKLAWTRHLLKLRTELADAFAHGDYEPLEVSGPHRDHVIAFARRRGRDAVIVAVARSFAAFSQGGRVWPRAENFDATLHIDGYSIPGMPAGSRARRAVQHLPVAVLKARSGAVKPARDGLPPDAKAARDRRPGGLADVVPTTRSVPFPRNVDVRDSLPTSRRMRKQVFRSFDARISLQCVSALVSSRWPRFRIATCAASANRCSSQGNVTSSRTWSSATSR